MKVMTVVGTRPEIIRLSRVIVKLEDACDHVLVHTGQNYDPLLNEIFLRELGLPDPDVQFVPERSTLGAFVGTMMRETEAAIGTCASDEVSRLVLEEGGTFRGMTNTLGRSYAIVYVPLLDDDRRRIGMLAAYRELIAAS